MRTLAIGDIHGCLPALESLAEAVEFTKDDRIVFLGDYVDRGPDSKGVLDFLINLKQTGYDVTFLRGNHEIMMLEARAHGRGRFMSWLSCGGNKTLSSYGEHQNFESVPDDHWQFLRDLKPFHETEKHIFVHAGLIPDLDPVDQPDYVLYWDFFDNPPPHQSGKTMICGHSSQKNGRPLTVGHATCIDTNAYGENGWLTCMEVNAGHCWRANSRGEIREDLLEAIANTESHH